MAPTTVENALTVELKKTINNRQASTNLENLTNKLLLALRRQETTRDTVNTMLLASTSEVESNVLQGLLETWDDYIGPQGRTDQEARGWAVNVLGMFQSLHFNNDDNEGDDYYSEDERRLIARTQQKNLERRGEGVQGATASASTILVPIAAATRPVDKPSKSAQPSSVPGRATTTVGGNASAKRQSGGPQDDTASMSSRKKSIPGTRAPRASARIANKVIDSTDSTATTTMPRPARTVDKKGWKGWVAFPDEDEVETDEADAGLQTAVKDDDDQPAAPESAAPPTRSTLGRTASSSVQDSDMIDTAAPQKPAAKKRKVAKGYVYLSGPDAEEPEDEASTNAGNNAEEPEEGRVARPNRRLSKRIAESGGVNAAFQKLL